jgi:hypothetical protein
MKKLLSMAVLVCAAAVGSGTAVAAAACDRECLEKFVNSYLAAMQAHDPRRVPTAPGVRYTENTVVLKLGQGLWATMNGLGSFGIHVDDVDAGQVAYIGTIRENGVPAILALRLKLADGKLAEAEALLHRVSKDATLLDQRGPANPLWAEALPSGEHPTRAALIHATNLYFEGIEHLDGNLVPFAADCNRVLDSTQDTNNPDDKSFTFGPVNPSAMNCRDNMNTRVWRYIHSVEPRRFEVVDRERGLVFGVFRFNHPGTTLVADIPGAGQFKMPDFIIRPSSLVAVEIFKIQGGEIHLIQGVTLGVPYLQPDPWHL